MKNQEIRKRFGSFLLSGVLIMSSSVPAFAEPVTDTRVISSDSFDIQENEADTVPDMVQPDLIVPDMNASDSLESDESDSFNSADGLENDSAMKPADTHSEDTAIVETQELTEESSLTEETVQDQMVIEDRKGDEKTITVLVKNPSRSEAAEKYLVAVWSEDKGQDDLVWYESAFSSEDDAYKTEIPVSAHKSVGTYHTHLYLRKANGSLVLKQEDTFFIHPVEAQSLEVSDLNNDKGTATVTLSGVSSPSGVNEVVFPIWSKPDQSDLVWYKGTKVSDGVYQVTLDISKHSYNYGTYQIHTYGRNGCNVQSLLKTSTCSFTRGEKSLDAVQKGSGYSLEARNLDIAGIKEYNIAVWSNRNGQDDLKWYTAKVNAQGTVSLPWIPGEYGTYTIHCYAKTTAGKMVFQKGIETTVEGASIEKMTVDADNSTGKFTITITGVNTPISGSKLLVPVWSDSKQADLIWYQATKQADGSYTVSSSIGKHGNRLGTYNVHLYVQEPSGKLAILDQTTFTVDMSAKAAISCSDRDEAQASFRVNVTVDSDIPVKAVQVPVWCMANQSDLVWYDAVKNADGTWSVTVEAKKHSYHLGTYQIHVYVQYDNGIRTIAGTSTYNLDIKNYLTVVNKGTGHRQVILSNPSASYRKVTFPTWSVTEGQNDLIWYNGVKQSDGNWVADIYAANHDRNAGTYEVHCYADDQMVGKTAITFAENEMITIGEQKVKNYVQQILNVTGRDLRSAYLWVVNNINYQKLEIPQNHPAGTTRQQYYFIYAFEHRTGNCFSYAATFYYCALELGYNAKLIEGRYRRIDGTHGEHAWVEIYINGVPYVCDPEIAWQSMLYDTYMRPYGSTTLTYYRNEAAY